MARSIRRNAGSLTAAALLVSATLSPVQAQVVPLGPEIDLGPGSGPPYPPEIEALPDGRFAVVWEGFPSGAGSDVLVSVRAADGSEIVAPFRANDYTPDDQYAPDVALADSGRFVVTWTNETEYAPPPCHACVRSFAADGTPDGVETELLPGEDLASIVNTAGFPNGDFVVAWSNSQPFACDPFFGCLPQDLFARRFASDGTPSGSRIEVSTLGLYNSAEDLDAISDGSFVLAWERPGGAADLRLQRFGADDAPIGDVTIISFGTSPRVSASEDGSFVLSSGNPPRVRRFDAMGDESGPTSIPLPTCEDPRGLHTDVAVSDDGGVLVAWDDDGVGCSDGDEWGVLARGLTAADEPIGPDFVVGTNTTGRQTGSRVESLGGGRYVVGWVSEGRMTLRLFGTECTDLDGDGYGSPASPACTFDETDCDDANSAVNPGMVELPGNGLDDDCDPGTPAACQGQP